MTPSLKTMLAKRSGTLFCVVQLMKITLSFNKISKFVGSIGKAWFTKKRGAEIGITNHSAFAMLRVAFYSVGADLSTPFFAIFSNLQDAQYNPARLECFGSVFDDHSRKMKMDWELDS